MDPLPADPRNCFSLHLTFAKACSLLSIAPALLCGNFEVKGPSTLMLAFLKLFTSNSAGRMRRELLS